jgi:predicted DNA-binding transcriptional regulator AlpA
MNDQLIRRKEVAKLLGIGLPTLSRWCAQGHIAKPIAIGPRAVAWRMSYISEFIAQRAGEKANPAAEGA